MVRHFSKCGIDNMTPNILEKVRSRAHVTILNGSKQDSPNVNGSPGVRKESIEIKMFQCV